MKKHLLPLLLVLCLALSLLPAAALAASEEAAPLALDTPADDAPAADPVPVSDPVTDGGSGDEATHSHTVCGGTSCTCGQSHTAVDWTAWDNTDSLPSQEGSYYLMADVMLKNYYWLVEKDISLCLNGYTITGVNDNATISVDRNGKLTLTDCKGNGNIKHADNDSGHGVYVNSGGTFTMYGGTITGNSETNGGGVYVGGSFTMYNGTISGNRGRYGGGVYVAENAAFNMSGGSITRNSPTITPSRGGGVYVEENATFTMSGGNIQTNTATDGGGVFVEGGTFTLSGGNIQTNTATNLGGGVYSAGIFKLSGAPMISENKQGNDDSNLYLGTISNTNTQSYKITIAGALSYTTPIGVSSSSTDASINFLTDWQTHMPSASVSEYFLCEKEGYTLSSDGKLIKDTYGISLSQTDSPSFPDALVGYGDQTPLTVTVTNTGNQPTGDLTVGVGGGNFVVSPTEIPSIAVGGSATFTVTPKSGLSNATYTAIVTVAGSNSISRSFSVSFCVKLPSSGTVPDPDSGVGSEPSTGTGVSGQTYGFLYDVQRTPAYPDNENQSISLSSFRNPYVSPSTQLETNAGSWTLSKVGTYGQMSETASKNLSDIVDTVAYNYSISDKNTIVVHELKNGTDHLAYGVVLAYDSTKVLFIGDTLSGSGAGYLLSTTSLSGEVIMTATAVGVDAFAGGTEPDGDPDVDAGGTEPMPSPTPTVAPTASPKPVSNSPKTGDESAVLLWAILLLGSGVAVTLCRKKKSK